MPLEENANLANAARKSNLSITSKEKDDISNIENNSDVSGTSLNVSKVRCHQKATSPREIRLKARNLDTRTEAPQLTLDDVNSPMNMAQVNGLFKEQSSPGRERNAPTRLTSSPLVRSALFSSEPSSEPQPWSAAVGPATNTGRSGRVIEKLQGELDKQNRDRKLLISRFEEVDQANNMLTSRIQYLQDRNSNYEQSHEANQRQLARKDRQLEELREELRREKIKTEKAEESARVAIASEEQWRDEATMAKAMAAQKEAEYDTIVGCRNRDNDRYQKALDKMRQDFDVLLCQREEDAEKHKRLELIAEQQRQTTGQLDDHTRKLNKNFMAYRTEIDTAIAEMRQHVTSNDSQVLRKLEEMTKVTGEMRWVMNIEREINGGGERREAVEENNTANPEPQPLVSPSKKEKSRPLSSGKMKKAKR